jgi:hypothetical protein
MDGCPAVGPVRMGLGLFIGILLLVSISRISLNLAGGLIFVKIKLFLNLTLTASQLLKTVFALELRANFFTKLSNALVGIGDVQRQSFRAFFKSLNRRLQRADGAESRVRDPSAVTVFAAQDHFGGVVETGTQEQIKTGEAPDADVIAKPGL